MPPSEVGEPLNLRAPFTVLGPNDALFNRDVTIRGTLTADGRSLTAPFSTRTPFATGTYRPTLRGPVDASRWTRYLVAHDANAPDSVLRFEHGQLVIAAVGGTGTSSERHELWTAPDVGAHPYGRVRSRWAAWPPADGIVQHIHVHRLRVSNGRIRAVVFWDGIFGSPIGGVWEGNLADGSGFVSAPASIVDREEITSASRAANGVVTANLARSGADTRWKVGDAVVVDLTDPGYDGSFVLTGVTSSQVTWLQTNGGSDASGGTGTLQSLGHDFTNFSTMTNNVWSITEAARVNGVVTSTGLGAGHPIQRGDRVVVDLSDATFDGRFVISAVNQTTNQVSWLQPGVADDASGGAGTITKNNPVWVETQVIPGPVLQARIWPDKGVDLNGGTPGPMLGAPPSWEQHGWTLTYDLSTVSGATVPDTGEFGYGAAHHSANSLLRYDGCEIEPYSVLAGV